MKKNLLLVGIITSMFLCTNQQAKHGIVSVNNQELSVEIADREPARARGLMFRKGLKDIQGMLFIFEHEGYHGFWMKNTYIPLEILFIDRNLEIVDLDTMAPLDTTLHLPLAPVKYVLELPLGSLERYKIKIGDRINYKLHD